MNQFRALKYPPQLFWEVTPLCNHNCVHCFNYWRTDDDKTIKMHQSSNLVDYMRMVEEIIVLNPVSVVITGGEPFVVWDKIKPCIELLRKNQITVSINTNASLVTDEIASFINFFNIPLFVSFPCSDEKICDEIISIPGSWKKINKGLQLLVRNNSRFKCNMVVSTKNISYVEDTVAFLKENYNIKNISISRVGKPINASNIFDNYLLDYNDIRRLIELCIKLKNKYHLSIDASAPYPTCSLETQEEYDYFAGKRLCSAGKTTYVLENDGSVKACPRDSKIYGNIFNEAFDVIWDRMIEWRDGSLCPNECFECKQLYECHGGCRVDVLGMDGHCNGLDSAARVDKLPLSFQKCPIEPFIYKDDTKFKVSDQMISVKENVGYRIAVNGMSTYVSDEAFDFLSSHAYFTVSDLINVLQVETTIWLIIQSLSQLGIIEEL